MMLPPPSHPAERYVPLYGGAFDGRHIKPYSVIDGRLYRPPVGYQWVTRLSDGLVGYGEYVTTEVEETRRDK
jgi:hypothetical protein